MGILMSERFNSLEDVFHHELKDLYDAEQRILKALPQMAEKAHNPNLKRAFDKHLRQTEKHIERLESVFEHRGLQPEAVKCHGVVGIISEGSDILSSDGDSDAIDAALIGAAQKVEHYEMASYGTLRTFAEHLGDNYSVERLQQTLDEEKETDYKLTEIAKAKVNPASV
jgi:ferritin-like metal-binding protein YciE